MLVVFIGEQFDRLRKEFGEMAAWKIATLFFGVRDYTLSPDPLNPYFLKRAGFSAARNLVIGKGMPAKIPTQRSMVGAGFSPFYYDGMQIVNKATGDQIAARDYYLAVPRVKSLLPTASNTVGIMSFSGCALFDEGKQCEFCIVGSTKGKQVLEIERVMFELKELEAAGYEFNNITINTGQFRQMGKDLKIIAGMAERIKSVYPEISIAAEIAPFSLLADIPKTSIDTFMVNVELVNDTARKKLCPGKPKFEVYLNAMEQLIEAGYEVSSVIQLNFYPQLESIDDVISGARKMIELGIVPEFLISRAVPGSRINDEYWQKLGKCSEKEAKRLMNDRFSEFVRRICTLTNNLPAFGKVKAGCVKCGMCNINTETNKKL